MEQRFVGRSGLRISCIGLSTATWGRGTDADADAAQLAVFRDGGGTLIDTAAGHGAGRAETVLGGLLGGSRDDVLVSTRPGSDRIHSGGPAEAGRGALLAGLDRSLRRLHLDHVDLWHLPPPDPRVPVEETLGALDQAVAGGKVRYAGVSDYPGWRLAQAATWQAAAPARAPIVAEHVEYSLLARGVEREVVPAGLGLGIGLICRSPLGGGALTGRDRASLPPGNRGDPDGVPTRTSYTDARSLGVVEAVATAAQGLATSSLAVALSWVLGRPGVTGVVVGARSAAQLSTTLQAATLIIPEAIRHALDEVSAPTLGYPEDTG